MLESMAIGVPLVTTRVGQAADLVRTARTAGWSSPRTSTGSSTATPLAGRREERARPRPRRRAAACRGERVRRAPAALADLLEGFVTLPDASAEWRRPRPSRTLRPRGGRWARLLTMRRRGRGAGLLRPRPRPRAGRARRRGHGEAAEARGALPEPPHRLLAPLPRHDVAPARPPAAPLARARRHPARREPGRCRLSRLGGRPNGRAQRAAPAALHAADHVLYQSAFSKLSADLFLGEPTARGRSFRTPSTSSASRPAPSPAGRARPPPRRRPDAGATGSSSRSGRFAASATRHAEARLLVTGRLVSDPAPLAPPGPRTARVELRRRGTRSGRCPRCCGAAHVLLHTKVKDPCPTAVIEAMALRLPVAYAASGGTVELVGDEAGIGVPHPTTGSGTCRRPRRRSPTRSTRDPRRPPPVLRRPRGTRRRAIRARRLARPPRGTLRRASLLRTVARRIAAHAPAERRSVEPTLGPGRRAGARHRSRRRAGAACGRRAWS